MKSKVIIGGAAIVALAGGVMFCGDEEILNEDPTTAERVFDNEDREPAAPEPEGADTVVTIDLGTASNASPLFLAVRTDEGWSSPKAVGGKVNFNVDARNAPYGVMWACESKTANGEAAIHTTLVETTPVELPTLYARCAAESSDKPIQVTGAIRGVNGESATLFDGTSSMLVENEKGASDVLFSTKATTGKHAFAAKIGDGEKAKFAVARDVDVKEGVTVEIDGAAGATLQAKTWTIQTDTNAQARFGEASVWMDGRTRVFDAGIQVDEAGVITHTSNNEADYVDLRADLHGDEKSARLRARYIARANRDAALPLPALTFAGPGYARIDQSGMDVSWSRRNWALFGYEGDELALFWPIAHVATVEHLGPNFRFDLVVTPMRALSNTPYFNVKKPSGIDGWEDRFWFADGATLSVRAGNLSAYAGADAPDPAAAVAAYLDENFSPADLGTNDMLAVVLAGSVTVKLDVDKDLSAAIETRCVDFRGCEANDKPGPPVPGALIEMAKSVQSCPDLEAFEDCETIEALPGEPPRFTLDLQREITRWYTKANIAEAVELKAALEGSKAESVKSIDLPDGSNFQVFSHPDPTRPDSEATWYGAYLNGRLISLHPVNLDATLK